MRARYLDEKEIEALAECLGPYAWLPFAVAIETGLRIGDVAALRWENLHGREIAFVAQKTGKAGKASVSEETARYLGQLRRRHVSPWIFPAEKDASRHVSRQVLWKRLKAACARCRINSDGISPHSFRKVYGVREYHAHGIAAAQRGLQHTDIATTEIYALADWLTEENADKPLLRSDLGRVIRYIADWLGIPTERPPR